MKNVKQWFQSRTVWVGVLTFLSGGVLALSGSIDEGIIMGVVGVINIVLRFLTTEQIK